MDFHSLNYLKSKIESYSQSQADAFHGPAPKAFPEVAKYIWETANTDRFGGFVYYGPWLAAYLNANGEEYILSAYIDKDQFSTIWDLNTQLYQKSLNDTRFRIVQPLGFSNGFGPRSFKTVTIDYIEYNYYNLLHPDNNLGNLIAFDKDMEPNNYAETLIEQVNILAEHLYSILGESNNYPTVKLNELVMNDNGVYWRFLHGWSLPKEGFLAKIDGEVEKALQTAVKLGLEPSMYLLEEGRQQWKKTLNI